MRLTAVFVALCALSQTAVAQISECRPITDAGTRLACYDRIATQAATPARPAARTAPRAVTTANRTVTTANDRVPKNGDSISAEDALVNARLKNICRGC
jgi:hypothetical protein